MTMDIKICETLNRIAKSSLLNWIFGRPALGNRSHPEAYAEWEFQNAGQMLACFKPYDDIKNKTILDVGCGFGGKPTFYALNGAKQVTAIDLDKGRIEAAREFAEKKGMDNIRFAPMDAASLAFASEQFDRVHLHDAFEHVRDPANVLNECYRVLAKGGRINLAFPPYASAWGAHLFTHIPIPWVQHFFREEVLVQIWKKEFAQHLRDKYGWKSPPPTSIYSQQRMETINNARTISDLTHLNMMSIKQYERILKDTAFKTSLYRVHTPGNMLNFLSSSPTWREYAVTRVVSVLEK